MREPLISVVILNYNGKNVIRQCLDSVLKQTYGRLDVIVVDNASADGSAQIIRDGYPAVRLIANKTNLGFGGGNNVGIKAARGEYVLMLNNDTRLDPDCIVQLHRSIAREARYGACASKIVLEYDQHLLDVAGIAVCMDGLSIGRGRLESKEKYDKEEEVFFASDCACLYRKSMLDDIAVNGEVYDEDFFAYADETDLGWRARLKGWKCVYNPRALVYHCHSASTGTYSPFKAFLCERNRIWVGVKSFPMPILLRGLGYTFQRYFFQAYGALTHKGAAGKFTKEASKRELVKILFKAQASAVRGLPKMIRKRREILAKKRISTGEMMKLFKNYGMSAKEISLKE